MIEDRSTPAFVITFEAEGETTNYLIESVHDSFTWTIQLEDAFRYQTLETALLKRDDLREVCQYKEAKMQFKVRGIYNAAQEMKTSKHEYDWFDNPGPRKEETQAQAYTSFIEKIDAFLADEKPQSSHD